MFEWLSRRVGVSSSKPAEPAINEAIVLLCETNGHSEGTFGKILSKDPADPDIPWEVELHCRGSDQPTVAKTKADSDGGEEHPRKATEWLRTKEFRRVEEGETVEVDLRANIVKHVAKRKGGKPKWVTSEDKAVYETWMIALPLREHIEKNTTAEGLLAIVSEQYDLPESRCEIKHCGEALRPMQILLQLGVRPSLHDKGHLLQLHLKPSEEEEYMEEHMRTEVKASGPDAGLDGLLHDLGSIGDKLAARDNSEPAAREDHALEPKETKETTPPVEPTQTAPSPKSIANPEDVIKKIFHPSQLPKKREEIDYDEVEVSSALPPVSVDQFLIEGRIETFKKPSRSVLYEAADAEGIEVVVKEMLDPFKFQCHRDRSEALRRLKRVRETIDRNGGLLPDGEPAEEPNPGTEAHVHVAKDRGFFRDSSATYPAAEEERRHRRALLLSEEDGEEEETTGSLFIVQEKGEYSLEAWLENNTPADVDLLALVVVLASLSSFFHCDSWKRADHRSAPKACQVDIPLSNIVWFADAARWKVVDLSSVSYCTRAVPKVHPLRCPPELARFAIKGHGGCMEPDGAMFILGAVLYEVAMGPLLRCPDALESFEARREYILEQLLQKDWSPDLSSLLEKYPAFGNILGRLLIRSPDERATANQIVEAAMGAITLMLPPVPDRPVEEPEPEPDPPHIVEARRQEFMRKAGKIAGDKVIATGGSITEAAEAANDAAKEAGAAYEDHAVPKPQGATVAPKENDDKKVSDGAGAKGGMNENETNEEGKQNPMDLNSEPKEEPKEEVAAEEVAAKEEEEGMRGGPTATGLEDDSSMIPPPPNTHTHTLEDESSTTSDNHPSHSQPLPEQQNRDARVQTGTLVTADEVMLTESANPSVLAQLAAFSSHDKFLRSVIIKQNGIELLAEQLLLWPNPKPGAARCLALLAQDAAGDHQEAILGYRRSVLPCLIRCLAGDGHISRQTAILLRVLAYNNKPIRDKMAGAVALPEALVKGLSNKEPETACAFAACIKILALEEKMRVSLNDKGAVKLLCDKLKERNLEPECYAEALWALRSLAMGRHATWDKECEEEMKPCQERQGCMLREAFVQSLKSLLKMRHTAVREAASWCVQILARNRKMRRPLSAVILELYGIITSREAIDGGSDGVAREAALRAIWNLVGNHLNSKHSSHCMELFVSLGPRDTLEVLSKEGKGSVVEGRWYEDTNTLVCGSADSARALLRHLDEWDAVHNAAGAVPLGRRLDLHERWNRDWFGPGPPADEKSSKP